MIQPFLSHLAFHRSIVLASKSPRRKRVLEELYHADLVIGADTVVILEGEVFDLPTNKADGRRMIERLNGKTHEVFSGAALVLPRYENGVKNHQIETFYETAKVTFGSLPPDVIEAYFENPKPWANVGGYAIERLGGTLIESIEGNYYTVVGFPVHKFCKEIYRMCSEGLL
ncbi:probable bifunctional dTTP/UTP pyrophosphatase/methyltransferase protein isoform X2 [Stegodyphus dumicola]|uniref:probable bifunctional dTTP/UTP pyrophosphatase/methyltransferase protein isoform X2 n=1 Tax=Stegodyphus dumicola TaxID=202533 RepID=UPI0015B36A37|nr:probable bifunctional dTTP/UTP pyrophosphatase/methyltransferase protein isoform X2 [Stegodyphus dumicola]